MNQIVTENEGLNDLPKGWLWTKLGEVGQVNPRIDFGNLRDDIDVSFLPMKCVEELTGRIDLSIVKRLSEVKKGYTSFKDGDLLFAKITPCMENGKVAIVDKLVNGIGFGSTEFHVLKLYDELPRKYFFHFLVQESVRRDAQRNMSGSAGQLRVPSRYMKSALIPLAPLSEQHRIVNKIEELFTKLDAGVENLNKIKIQLKRYRQSVLKSAFEGKLTEEWRKQNKEKIEPADKLLNRILGERRDMCEERELAKMKTRGKVPRDQIWKEKYKEPEPPNTDGLMELPEGWCWASVEQLASDMPHSIQSGPFGSNLHHKEFQDSGKLVIGIDNVQDGRFSLGAEHRINDHKYWN
jgi:type I restriction enzyme S subunit